MEHLYQKLTKYSEKDYYPLHMPGHKRKPGGDLPAEYFRRDITEIDGFDNLINLKAFCLRYKRGHQNFTELQKAFIWSMGVREVF